jgi:hypothetical protein
MSTTTTIRFNCPVCSKPNEQVIPVPDVNWGVEPLGDSLSVDDDVVVCQHCDEHLSAHIENSPSFCSVEFEDYPGHPVDADDAPFALENANDWLQWDPPPKPYDELREAMIGMNKIASLPLNQLISLPQVIRMAYAQTVAALEAYLGDTLITRVMNDHEKIRKMATGSDDLKQEKLTLDVVLDNPNIVRDKVHDYLRDILFHNLAKADALYKIALGFGLLGDKDRNKRLFRAVQLRHDIVHRNGKSKDGVAVQIEPDHVKALIADVLSLARDVEDKLNVPGVLYSPAASP